MNNSGQGSVILQDSAPVPLQNLKIFGWSTQDGTPSPENPVPIVSAGDGGSIALTVSDGAEQSQSLILSTPNGLPGIPVDSGGNYTDAEGQIFFSSFRDYASKTDVTRVKPFHVDTSPSSAWHSRNVGEYVDLYTYNTPTDYQVGYKNIMCEFLPYNYNVFGGANLGCCLNGSLTSENVPYFIFSFNRQTFNALKEDSQETVIQKFKNYIGADGFSIFYICNPIETPLSEEEITAFQNLTAYSPTTIVSNDANAWMWVQYLLESEMSPWFYPKTEIGLYYKAYAGYETELPAPTCRETKLIKKLLDSSYQLDFEVTERSSRTEKYLWDLISKTNTMLANIPKTDTEKFLHILLGGEVTEYPIIDCERNYWMSKSVEQ